MTKSFEEHLEGIQQWMEQSAASNSVLNPARPWCTLGIKSLTQDELRKNFDRTDVNTKFAEEFGKNDSRGTPYAFMQHEADLIYSLHKGMVARHKGRLMHYRDDCSQKNYRNYSALSIGLAKYVKTKEAAEQFS